MAEWSEAAPPDAVQASSILATVVNNRLCGSLSGALLAIGLIVGMAMDAAGIDGRDQTGGSPRESNARRILRLLKC